MTRSQFGLFRFKGHSNRDPLSRCRLDTRPVQSRSVKVPGDQSVNLPCISTLVEMQRIVTTRCHGQDLLIEWTFTDGFVIDVRPGERPRAHGPQR